MTLVAATLASAATARAQQANSNRLMFDPAGLQSTESRSFAPSSQPATTVGQSTAAQQPASTAKPGPAQKPAATPRSAAASKPLPPPGTQPAAAPRAQPRATPSAPTAQPRTAARRPAADAVNEPTPTGSRAAVNAAPVEQPKLGRVPLDTGSIGFENQTQLRDYNMSDGGRVPGFENRQRNDSSYFGLSLRMPTTASPSNSSSSSASSSSPFQSLFGQHGPN